MSLQGGIEKQCVLPSFFRPKAAVQYETMVARKMGSPTPAQQQPHQPGTSSLVAQPGKSPTPPPLPNPPSESDLKRINEETAAAEAEREKGMATNIIYFCSLCFVSL